LNDTIIFGDFLFLCGNQGCIVYVHAWTGQVGDVLERLHGTPQGLLRWALIELLGRSAVPLLSVISGWLAGASLARRGWPAFAAGKARTILADVNYQPLTKEMAAEYTALMQPAKLDALMAARRAA